jgi:hypothetical protein
MAHSKQVVALVFAATVFSAALMGAALHAISNIK